MGKMKSVKKLGITVLTAAMMFGAFGGLAHADTDTTAPSNVTMGTPSSTEETITLNWSPATDNVGVDHYSIYTNDSRLQVVGDQQIGVVAGNVTTFTISNLQGGNLYGSFWVKAWDASGNVSSGIGSSVGATTATATHINAGAYGVSASNPNNTSQLQDAINAGISSDLPVILPAGTIVSNGGININLHPSETFEIYGQGSGSTTLKRADGSITGDNQHLFYFKMPYTSEYDGINVNSISVKLHDLTVDGNKRGNSPSVAVDHSSNIHFLGYSEDYEINTVKIYNVNFNDPIADNIRFGGTDNSFVDNVEIYNVNSNNFSSANLQSDIYGGAGMNSMNIHDSSLTAVEANFASAYLDHPFNTFRAQSQWTLNNNTISRILDLKGKDYGDTDEDGYPIRYLQASVYGGSIQKLHVNDAAINVYNSTVYLGEDPVNREDSIDGYFSNVTFKHVLNGSGNITPLTFYAYDKNRVTLDGNSFVVDSSNPSINPDGFSIWLKPTASTTDNMEYYLLGNTFDSRMKKNVDIDRADYVELLDNSFSGTDYAVRLNSNTTRPLTVDASSGNTWINTNHFSIVGSGGLTLIQ
jgi:hypothetical protein